MLTHSSRKTGPIILLVLVLAGTFIQVPVNSQTVYSCSLRLLAVDESKKGIVIKFELRVEEPGFGDIQYDKVEEDTATSFKLALIYASMITGTDYKCCNYKLSVETSVKGLSATLAFYMFLVDFFSHNACPRDYTATGIIGPGGIVGVVSGFEEKLRAASEEGLKVYGQAFQVKNANATNLYAPVVPVYTVYDAYRALGGQLGGDLHVLEKYTEAFLQAFLEPYKSLLETTEMVLSRIESINWKDGYFERSLQLLNLAKNMSSKNKYYAASSIAFRALVQAYSSWINHTLFRGEGAGNEVEEAVKNALEEADRVMLEVENELSAQVKQGYVDLVKLDALSAAYMRAYETAILLEKWEGGEIGKCATALARSNSAVAWLNVSKLLNITSKPVDVGILEASLPYIRDYWNTLRDYLTYMGMGTLLVDGMTISSNSSTGEYLAMLVQLYWLSSTLYSSEIGLTAFARNATMDDASAVLNLAKLVLAWTSSLAGFTPVEPLLVIDLAQTYLELGEEPSTIIALLYGMLSKAAIYALTARAIQWAASKPSSTPVTYIDREVALAIGVVLIAGGTLLVGISVKRRFTGGA
ncbi:MAG: hypothetical protein QXL28_03230 [Desulfurococcaceae archaeon]